MNGDNANRQFICEYEFDGDRWGVRVWASTLEEAEMKFRAISAGKVLGAVGGIVICGRCPTCGRETDE